MSDVGEQSMTGIDIHGLSKHYPRSTDLLQLLRRPFAREVIPALLGIDYSFRAGRIYGIVGPNGAGKTTLLKVVAGLVSPTRGQVLIGGADIERHPRVAREAIGYVVADERSFYWRLSVRENMRFFAALQGLAPGDAKRRIHSCLERVGLAERAEQAFGSLSTGMRQQLAIARGILLDPPILLMDEPTRSLDPEVAHRVRELVRGLVEERQERLVLLSSHNLDEVEELCSHVVLLRAGRIVDGPAGEQAKAPRRYRIRTRDPIPDGLLQQLAGVTLLRCEERRIELEVARLADLDEVVDRLRGRGIGLLEMEPQRLSLEDVMHRTGEEP